MKDGTIDVASFSSWDEVAKFLGAQEDSWRWTKSLDLDGGAALAADRIRKAFSDQRRKLQELQSYGNGFRQGAEALRSAFDEPDGKLISTQSPIKETASEVAEAISTAAAIFVWGFERGIVTLADARTRDDLQAVLWLAVPGLPNANNLSNILKTERSNARALVRRVTSEAANSNAEREKEWKETLRAADEKAIAWAKMRSKRFRRASHIWRDRHAASEASIKAVEEAYKEQMGLKAPVEYWDNKAKSHGKSEFWARLWVLMYFPAALTILSVSFSQIGWTLINASLNNPDNPLPSGVYIIASAGLASGAGLLFWVGRLLTKLYLSQHHLRQDADERATMTKTYLALIENSAADIADRQIILNALFRTTPDGIVKEEGGLDPSIGAALGKFLARP